MKDFVKKLYNEMSEDVALFAEMGQPPMNRLGGALKTMHDVMLRLRKYVLETGFTSDADQITFFKYEKPKFVAEQIYLTDLTLLLIGRPGSDDELLKVYYEEELKRLRLFISRFGFLYQCYTLDADDLDAVLFLRGAVSSGMVLPSEPTHDPDFSTAGDHLWAKFMAYDRLREWLENELHGLGGGGEHASGVGPDGSGPVLKWTGNTINIAELAYGIWLTGQINNGNVSVSEIVVWLERHFRVKIGDAHRRWQSIASRKRIGPFVYMDEMKAALVKRLEDEWGK